MSDEEAAKAVMALRLAGHTHKEIALEVGCSVSQVRRLLHLNAPKRKVFEDIIDGRALPAALDNLIEGLEAGDKDYTIKTLEGRGLLVKHSHAEGQAPKSAFQFNIVVESPADGHREPLIGAVVGEPRQLESSNE
jgi:predicted transcriptional regulator